MPRGFMASAIKLITEQENRMTGSVELSWSRFCRQLSRDGNLWLVCILLLTLYRLLFLTVFSARIAVDSGLPTIWQSMGIGFRFDSKVATMAMAPSFVFTVISGFVDWEHRAERLRLFMGILFWGCIVVLGRIAIGYFKDTMTFSTNGFSGCIMTTPRQSPKLFTPSITLSSNCLPEFYC